MVHKFQWSGGGEWAGKAWSAELPTDTALLLFLFSAFLAVTFRFSLLGFLQRCSGGLSPVQLS